MTKFYLFFYAHSRLRRVGAFNVELLDILHIMLFNLKIKIKSNKFSIKLYLLIILHHMEVSLSKNLGSVKNPKSGDTLKLLLLNSNLQKG